MNKTQDEMAEISGEIQALLSDRHCSVAEGLMILGHVHGLTIGLAMKEANKL